MAQNWSFVAAGTVATGANPAPALPTGWAQGDLLVVVATSGATYSATPPTGYTQAARHTASPFLTVWYKTAGSSESSPTLTNTSTASAAVIVAYRNIAAFDAVSTVATASSTTIATSTTTTTKADDLVLSIYGGAIATSGTRAWTAPTGTTGRVLSSRTTALTGMMVAEENQAATGTTTARTGTTAQTAALDAYTVAFKQKTSYPLTANAGSYSLTGSSATLTKTSVAVNYTLTGNAGSYSYTGVSASLKVGRKITGNAGSYSLAGGSGVLKVGRTLTGSAGSYALTGGSATLTKSAGATAYSLTGTAGSYALTGGSAILSHGWNLTGNAGSYLLTGGNAVLSKTMGPQAYTLTANAGAYQITGGQAELVWSGEKKAAGGYGDTRKKRYVVEVNGRLVEFSDANAATQALNVTAPVAAQKAAVKRKAKPAQPLFSVSLEDVRKLAAEREALDVYKAQLAQMQYESLLRQYEVWQDEQDIEDLLALI